MGAASLTNLETFLLSVKDSAEISPEVGLSPAQPLAPRDLVPIGSSDHGCCSWLGKAGALGGGFPVDLSLPML